jgi:peptidoglycan/LPS O-acetylase OafA/YrhL
MAILRRALLLFAAVWAVCGIAIVIVPRWLLVTWFDQPGYPDYTYVRVCGVAALGSAALALMISRRLDEVWWWSWAFVLEAGATALVTGLHAVFDDGGAWFWWLFAVSNAALAAFLVAGIARAGVEKPIV